MSTRKTIRRYSTLIVALALTFAGGMALAQEPVSEEPMTTEATETEQATLTGQLTVTDDGDYMLVEPASGEAILLATADEELDLSAHVDTSVEVTGVWDEADDGSRTFVVTAISPTDAS